MQTRHRTSSSTTADPATCRANPTWALREPSTMQVNGRTVRPTCSFGSRRSSVVTVSVGLAADFLRTEPTPVTVAYGGARGRGPKDAPAARRERRARPCAFPVSGRLRVPQTILYRDRGRYLVERRASRSSAGRTVTATRRRREAARRAPVSRRFNGTPQRRERVEGRGASLLADPAAAINDLSGADVDRAGERARGVPVQAGQHGAVCVEGPR